MIAAVILPGQRAADVIAEAAAIARWEGWLCRELPPLDEYERDFNVRATDRVIAFCTGYLDRPQRDHIHTEWAREIIRDLFNA